MDIIFWDISMTTPDGNPACVSKICVKKAFDSKHTSHSLPVCKGHSLFTESLYIGSWLDGILFELHVGFHGCSLHAKK